MLSKIKNFFNKTEKTELYVQVVAAEENTAVLSRIGTTGPIVKIDLLDLPENKFRCSAFKITIEPIEHTFANPCEEWKKSYKPKVISDEDLNLQRDNLKKMFGVFDDE